MTQHFHNTFIILLYFILNCKELTVQQFRKYCDDNKMSKYFHTKKKCYIHDIFTTNHKQRVVTGCYWWTKK